MCVLDTPALCICYNPDGTMLAVGLGGGLEADTGEWIDWEEKHVSRYELLGQPMLFKNGDDRTTLTGKGRTMRRLTFRSLPAGDFRSEGLIALFTCTTALLPILY